MCWFDLSRFSWRSINSLPDDKFSALFKLEAFADDKLSVAQNKEFVFHMVENIDGK